MKITLLLPPVLALMLTGCEMVDSQMLQQLQEYFPQAEIQHPRPDILAVKTHVENVSEKFVQQTVATLLREHCCHQSGVGISGLLNQDLDAILPAAGYQILAIDFPSTLCTWGLNNPQTFNCRARPFDANQVHTYAINDQVSFIPQLTLRPQQKRR